MVPTFLDRSDRRRLLICKRTGKYAGRTVVMKKSRNKTSDFEPIGRALEKTIRDFRKSSDMELTRIWEYWDEIVGAAVAENAQPAAFKGHILVVNVISSTWIQQLRFVKDELI